MFVLGIDYGKKRIGLALGETETSIASPFSIVHNNQSGVKKILDIIKEYGIQKIICGNPVEPNPTGSQSKMQIDINQFLEDIKSRSNIDRVVLVNETLTSAIIDKKKKKIDALSAQLILEEYFANIDRYEKDN